MSHLLRIFMFCWPLLLLARPPTAAAFASMPPLAVYELGPLPGAAPHRTPLAMESARDRLLRVANDYASKTFVPYVWGGNALGEPDDCDACRACVAKKTKLKVERRAGACSACRKCGIDCSHFISKIYNAAGDRKSTRLNSSHIPLSRMPSSA